MVPWYNFVQPDGAEPDMLVRPYERYVQECEFGPTAIDRAMIHTFMLDLDHERRFAVSQLPLECSTFEAHHCNNVSRAIDFAVRRFDAHGNHEALQSTTIDDIDLIGLKCLPVTTEYPTSIPSWCDDPHESVHKQIAGSERATSMLSTHSSSSEQRPIVVGERIVVDDVEADDQSDEDLAETVRQIYKEKRELFTRRPRQYTAKRIRKSVVHTHSESKIAKIRA